MKTDIQKKLSICFLYTLLFTFIACEKESEIPEETETSVLEEKRFNFRITPNEVGGSNYPMFDTQGWQDTGVWSSPDNLKLVVGHYHLNPAKVNSQLRAMYSNGQRKIALVIWYTHFPPHWPNTNTHLHTIRGNNARLPYQQEQNLKNVLRKIKSIGYNEVIIRFATQGIAHPGGWNGWDENQFQENWNFIYHTVNTSESTLGSASSIKRVYDLDVEMGGRTDGQTKPYMDKLWRNFSYRFPHLKSYAFSIAYAPGRLNRLIKLLKATGRTPDEYAIDLYEHANLAIYHTKRALVSNRESHKSVVIQETYYNDPNQYLQLKNSIKSNNLKVRYIMQWPWKKGSPRIHFSENYPQDYNNYLPLDIEHIGR